MNNFWTLVKYEYKKIFMKKMTWIFIILAVLTTLLGSYALVIGNEYISGEVVGSNYDSMNLDRNYARNLSGKPIDDTLLLEASSGYNHIPLTFKEKQYSSTQEYQAYARPYSEIYAFAHSVYNKMIVPKFTYIDMQNLTKEQTRSFYEIRTQKILQNTEELPLKQQTQEKIMKLDNLVQKPIIYEYTGGYDRYINVLYTSGLIEAFLIVIFLAPIFCGEYMGSDQIILSSKNGKKTLIKAKLFTGFTLSAGVATAITLLTYFSCMHIYGADGANGAIQLRFPLSTLPLTVGQTSILFSICVLFACILIAAITMGLSSKIRTPFVVMIIMTMLIITPMFINIPTDLGVLHRLVMLLPTNMMAIWNITSPMFYELLGISIEPYIFMPIFSIVSSILLVLIANKSFKNHQVG